MRGLFAKPPFRRKCKQFNDISSAACQLVIMGLKRCSVGANGLRRAIVIQKTPRYCKAKGVHCERPHDSKRRLYRTMSKSITSRQAALSREAGLGHVLSRNTRIQKMVASLRTRKAGGSKNEVTRVITVRLPESLHEALKAEASDHSTSMNKLCISKLLQVLVENEKAAKNSAAPRPASLPSNPVPKPTPSPLATQPAPSTPSPNFRSTYTPPTNPGQPFRFGQ